MIIGGIYPRLCSKLVYYVERWMPKVARMESRKTWRASRKEKRNLPTTCERKFWKGTISHSWVLSRRCRART